MASSHTALKYACKVARRRNRTRPIIIVHQPTTDYEKITLKEVLKDYEQLVNNEMGQHDDDFDPVSIEVSSSTVVIKDVEANIIDSKKKRHPYTF